MLNHDLSNHGTDDVPSALDIDAICEYDSQRRESSLNTSATSECADEHHNPSSSSFAALSDNTPRSVVSSAIEQATSSSSALSEATPTMSSDDKYLALGTIHLQCRENEDGEPQLVMQGPMRNEPYPNEWMNAVLRKGWIRLHEVTGIGELRPSFLRIFVLPEDVDRGNRGALKDFRKVIKHLLRFVNRSVDAWRGIPDKSSTFMPYETPSTIQEESLFYIFNTLQSPSPHLDSFHVSTDGYHAVNDVMNGSVLGLKTQLYAYQRRSVSTMIQREAEPAKILDPRKPIFKDVYDKPFYLDVDEGALLKNAPLYNEPQGGILAETMGYGKTLICIALILATRGHYPKVPEDRVDSIPFRPRQKVGSLLAMAARRTKYEGLPWKAEFSRLSKAGLHYDHCLEELGKYEREYAEPIFTPTTPDRKGKRDSANVVRLCSATLIIVPPNLLVQWQQEIEKHTEQDALDVLIIDSAVKQMPSWQELLKQDVVLITKARFEQEYRDDDLHRGNLRTGEARYRSSLTEVRWLRVICDEGHGFAGSSSRTNAMTMLDKMYIERRWVVSGTPSSTLHGVEVGLSTTNSSSLGNGPVSPSPDAISTRKDSLNSALQKRRVPSARDLEAKDLERLRLIVVNFLKLQPWANRSGSSDVANWKKYLFPFVGLEGIHRTSPALREVLQSLIIRHRIEDIDTDLTLPPLHNRIVYLNPSYHDKLAINMFFLVLTSNYVTSEREDEDYMFHPRNRKTLDQLINNLRQATFHWVGFSEHDVKETLRISNDYFNKNVDKISDADGLLLTEAIMNGERALADPSWRAFSTLHEVGVYVNRFPEHAREAWALDESGDDPVLLGTVQAREAQKHLRNQYLKGTEDCLSGFAGAGVRIMNAAKTRAEDENKVRQKAKEGLQENERQHIGATEEPKLKASPTSLKAASRSSMLKSPSSVTPKKRRRSSVAGSRALITPPTSPDHSILLPTPPSPTATLAETTISSFTSSKLTYLTSRLLSLPSSTKSLVFYQHNNTAFFIAEALELLSIPFRIYANTLSVAQRNEYLAEFNSESSDFKVLLMDVKQASHGLHVACASYVCIVSPIWDAGVESQAIKRAHRIGQTQEVIVETLVLRTTFEEEMVRRRKWKDEHLDLDHESNESEDVVVVNQAMPVSSGSTAEVKRSKSRTTNLGKSLLDDRHMVSVMKDIKFMKFSPEEESISGRVKEMDVPKEKRLLFKSVLPDLQKEVSRKDGENQANDDGNIKGDKSRLKLRKLNARVETEARSRVGFAQ